MGDDSGDGDDGSGVVPKETARVRPPQIASISTGPKGKARRQLTPDAFASTYASIKQPRPGSQAEAVLNSIENEEAEHEALRAPGSMVGQYIIDEVIGAGGMGVVYAARDPKLDRTVAIKVIRRSNTDLDERLGDRLVREAQSMAKLSHPNVVTVYEAGTVDGEIFLAMEFVKGCTLADWLREPRSWREIVKTFIGAGRGLEAAHAVGLIHRDFKPDNVLINVEGRPRVTDFGIARQDGETDAEHNANELVGTPRYMSPEQCQGQSVDSKSDQFSFCICLYEALYHDHPFSASAGTVTLAELIMKISEGQRVKPPKDVRLPRWLKRVIDRGLSIKPADRFPSMTELLDELERSRADWRRYAAAGLLAAALAGVGWRLGRADQSVDASVARCTQASANLAQLWNPTRKQEVEKSFMATQVGFADHAYKSVSKRLDDYVVQLGSMQEDSCREIATHRDERSELYEARSICLSYRRGELTAVVDLFAHADKGVVEHAVEAAQTLGDLRQCTDDRALTPTVPLPKDIKTKAKVDEARELDQKAELSLSSGRFEAGMGLAAKAIAAARAGGYAPVLADSLIISGRLQWHTGHMEEARAAFLEAVAAAERGQKDVAKGLALTWLMEVIGTEGGDYRAGEMLGAMASSALDRAGGNAVVAGQLHFHMGRMALLNGDAKTALEHEQKSLQLREAALGPLHGDVAMSLMLVGSSLHALGRYDEALEYERKALTVFKATYGEGHPNHANALNEVGNVFVAKGDLRQAIATYQEAITRLEASVGRMHPDVAITLSNLGTALLSQADAPPEVVHEAIGHYKEALGIEQQVLGADHEQVAETLRNLGRAELRLQDGPAAVESLQAAMKIFNQHRQQPADRGDLRFDLAKASLLAKQLPDAKEYARRAAEDYDTSGKTDEAQEVRDWLAALR